MKKLSRRQFFKGAGTAGIGGAALAVGLKPAVGVLANAAKGFVAPLNEIAASGWKTWHSARVLNAKWVGAVAASISGDLKHEET